MADKTIEILEQRGAIARIAPPPLIELPGWKTRAAKLEKVNILDAEQFLEAEEGLLIDAMKARTSLIRGWKEEVTQWLTIPEQEG